MVAFTTKKVQKGSCSPLWPLIFITFVETELPFKPVSLFKIIENFQPNSSGRKGFFSFRWNKIKCPPRMPTTLFTAPLESAHDPLPCRSFGPAFAVMNGAPRGSSLEKCLVAAPCKLHCLTISSLTITASNLGMIWTVNNFWGLSEKEQCGEW